jgi:hypothetical protein
MQRCVARNTLTKSLSPKLVIQNSWPIDIDRLGVGMILNIMHFTLQAISKINKCGVYRLSTTRIDSDDIGLTLALQLHSINSTMNMILVKEKDHAKG